MRKKQLFVISLGLTLFCITSHLYINFFVKDMIVGTYINRNYEYEPFIPGIPYMPDTLKILDNNKFLSSHWV
jgi:hypothetical protein